MLGKLVEDEKRRAERNSRLGMRSPAARRQRLAKGAWGLGIPWLLGLGTVALAEQWQARSELDELTQQAELVALQLEQSWAAPLESLLSLQQLLEGDGAGVSAQTFSSFCEPALERHPTLLALEWLPWVEEAHRETFEGLMRSANPAFTMLEPVGRFSASRASVRPRHLPIAYVCPPRSPALGLDLGRFLDGYLGETLAKADAQKLAVGRPEQLLEAPTQQVLAVFAPVRHAAFAPQGGQPVRLFERGFVAAVFRLPDLITSSLNARLSREYLVSVTSPNNSKGDLVRTNRSGGSISAVHPLRFAGERYLLTLAPKQRRSRGLLVALFLAVGGFGSVIWLLRRSEARGEELQSRLARLGHYELEGKIGEGAMATVYKARHALLKRPTAIKIANAELPAHLFEREVRLQSALSHPNTTTVYDFGQGDNGQLYCAMEYIEGYDLDRLVRLFGPLPPARAIRILSQVAASLSEAHQKMFIHQDIKPKNIMITERGNVRDFVKVLDFGLARVRPAEPSLGQTNASTAGQFLGTPGFAAPEIAAGARGSPASDIFSLGAVGYFLLTGRGPFEDPGLRLVTSLSVEERSAALPSHVPWPLASLVAQCLSRSPPERPLKMTSIVERLRAMNATITPWTADDAEQWWRDHPPSVTPSSQSSKSFPLPV